MNNKTCSIMNIDREIPSIVSILEFKERAKETCTHTVSMRIDLRIEHLLSRSYTAIENIDMRTEMQAAAYRRHFRTATRKRTGTNALRGHSDSLGSSLLFLFI